MELRMIFKDAGHRETVTVALRGTVRDLNTLGALVWATGTCRVVMVRASGHTVTIWS